VRIVTSGARYLDIDGYAAAVGYAELLRAQGTEAKAVSTTELNDSIPPSLRDLEVDFHASYNPAPADTFSVMDVSDPAYFDPIVDLDRVAEVIDHHLGFEQHWAAHPDTLTDIEFIGANCTQIFERWKQSGLLGQMSPGAAKLLACGILDNTLNFQAKVTTGRDRKAYKQLAVIAQLGEDWPRQYFTACEDAMLEHLPKAILGDSKILKFKTFPEPLGIGQLVVWDPAGIIPKYEQTIAQVLSKIRPNWFMNVIGLKDLRSTFVSDDSATMLWLEKLLEVKFDGTIAPARRPWLRKEIVHADLNFERSK
jgi:inorganic pyrophosphatase/exopolyphosphatase